MSKPTLYIFTISHYCEKARWALEYLGVAHVVKPIAPGIHLKTAQKLGLRRGSLPYLTDGDAVIQGSSQVIDWAEVKSEQSLGGGAPAVSDVESRLDDITGIHVRRMFYSEAIVHHPRTVRPVFEKGLGFIPKTIVRLKWDMVCDVMIKGMDLGDAQFLESQKILDGELDWLDGLLADGRQYLVGDTFSRADITAASLLGPLVNPPKHPAYRLINLPPNVTKTVANWAERPTLKYISRIYADHR